MTCSSAAITSHHPLEGFAMLNMAILLASMGILFIPFFFCSVFDLYGLYPMQLIPQAWYTLVGILFLFVDHLARVPNFRFWTHLYKLVEVALGVFDFDAWFAGSPL